MDPNATTTAVTTAASSSGGGSLASSPLAGVIVSFVSALGVYAARQSWERKKLRRALLTEISQMNGLNECANQMNRISGPPGRSIKPDDVPAPGSIPTTIYESNAGNIGLLSGLREPRQMEEVVSFYSKCLRYKSIIADIRSDGDTSDTDQEDLYDHIEEVREHQKKIIERGGFVQFDYSD